MSAQPSSMTRGVTLLRMGVGKQTFEMPPGATLDDLLRTAGADPENPEVLIDGKPLAEWLVLEPGMIVSISPRPAAAPDDEPWRKTIGMFRDDPGFEELLERVEADRRADRG